MTIKSMIVIFKITNFTNKYINDIIHVRGIDMSFFEYLLLMGELDDFFEPEDENNDD